MIKRYEAMSGQYAHPKFAVVNVAAQDIVCISIKKPAGSSSSIEQSAIGEEAIPGKGGY